MSIEKRVLKTLRGIKRMLTPPEGLSLQSVEPVSRWFARDRGTPVDRYYIERFLAGHRHLIQGRLLEVGDDEYSRQFGSCIVSSDVLHLTGDNPRATLVADLTLIHTLPVNRFDCFVCTQTLNFIFDTRAAVEGMYQLLAPGGTVLATVAGISQVSRSDMNAWGDYWRFTTLSARNLFSQVFGEEQVAVDYYGNCLTACSFLRGIAAEELPAWKLAQKDADYPVTITVIARKAEDKTRTPEVV